MKALTVRQPHASLIQLNLKHIETRSWNTAFRGPLLIHAGKSIDHYAAEGFDSVWHEHGFCFTDSHRFPLGAIVASCKLVDVVPIVRYGDVPEAFGRFIEDVITPYGPSLWLCDHRTHGGVDTVDRVQEQRLYGDFTPGRFAWLIEDIKPVEQRCPACWVNPDLQGVCLTCDGHGRLNPIPTKGKLGLWEWTP